MRLPATDRNRSSMTATPTRGGDTYFAGWLENAFGFKAEIVADI
jgi:hypothetical protein